MGIAVLLRVATGLRLVGAAPVVGSALDALGPAVPQLLEYLCGVELAWVRCELWLGQLLDFL